MPPRHTSQCRRVIQSQIAPTRDSVWISDGQLAAVFERYCYVSRQSRRKASNVPGPLESRRRLGRRQITDLNTIHNTHSLPAWALPNAVDMSKWHWEPPTSATEREERQQQLDQLSFMGWPSVSWPSGIRNWVSERLGPGQPSDVSEPQTIPIETLAQKTPQDRTRVPVAKTTAAASFREEIAAFCALPSDTATNVAVSDYRHLCRKFEQYLQLGHITKSQLSSLSKRLWEALDAKFSTSSVYQDLQATLVSAIVAGLATSRALNLASLDTSFWNTLLLRVSTLPTIDDAYCLFEQLMHIIPSKKVSFLSEGILSVLEAFFSSWATRGFDGDVVRLSTWLDTASSASERLQVLLDQTSSGLQGQSQLDGLTQMLAHANTAHADLCSTIKFVEDSMSTDSKIRAIATALERISPHEQGDLLEAALQLLQKQAPASLDLQRQMHYAWLAVMSHMPLVGQDFLFDAAARLLDNPGTSSLDAMEICSLALSQWQSRGYLGLPGQLQHHYQQTCSGNDSKALASLLFAVFSAQPTEYRGIFISLCRFMQKLGRQQELVHSFKALGATQLVRVSLLQEVALAAKDHHLAMELHGLYKYHLHTPGGPEWDPAVFRGYVKAMVADPKVRPSRIWESLDIDMYEDGPGGPKAWKVPSRNKSRHLGRFGKQRVAIVEDIALHISLAPHLRNRVAFRHVSQCIRFLAEHKGQLSPTVVKAVYHVVSRDLVEGLPGRTTRLQWVLDLVSKYLEPDVAHRCEVLLKRWRQMLKNRWVDEGEPVRRP